MSNQQTQNVEPLKQRRSVCDYFCKTHWEVITAWFLAAILLLGITWLAIYRVFLDPTALSSKTDALTVQAAYVQAILSGAGIFFSVFVALRERRRQERAESKRAGVHALYVCSQLRYLIDEAAAMKRVWDFWGAGAERASAEQFRKVAAGLTGNRLLTADALDARSDAIPLPLVAAVNLIGCVGAAKKYNAMILAVSQDLAISGNRRLVAEVRGSSHKHLDAVIEEGRKGYDRIAAAYCFKLLHELDT